MLGITMLTEIFYGKYSMHVLLSLNFKGCRNTHGNIPLEGVKLPAI